MTQPAFGLAGPASWRIVVAMWRWVVLARHARGLAARLWRGDLSVHGVTGPHGVRGGTDRLGGYEVAYLHWVREAGAWRLHGTVLPPHQPHQPR